jgi:hypothetical protein
MEKSLRAPRGSGLPAAIGFPKVKEEVISVLTCWEPFRELQQEMRRFQLHESHQPTPRPVVGCTETHSVCGMAHRSLPALGDLLGVPTP